MCMNNNKHAAQPLAHTYLLFDWTAVIDSSFSRPGITMETNQTSINRIHVDGVVAVMF